MNVCNKGKCNSVIVVTHEDEVDDANWRTGLMETEQQEMNEMSEKTEPSVVIGKAHTTAIGGTTNKCSHNGTGTIP